MGSLAALSERLNGSGLPWDHTTCVASQVVRGLQHLQSRTMLHRDVKPQNVLHARNGNVKLADFGISKDGLGPTGCVLWCQFAMFGLVELARVLTHGGSSEDSPRGRGQQLAVSVGLGRSVADPLSTPLSTVAASFPLTPIVAAS